MAGPANGGCSCRRQRQKGGVNQGPGDLEPGRGWMDQMDARSICSAPACAGRLDLGLGRLRSDQLPVQTHPETKRRQCSHPALCQVRKLCSLHFSLSHSSPSFVTEFSSLTMPCIRSTAKCLSGTWPKTPRWRPLLMKQDRNALSMTCLLQQNTLVCEYRTRARHVSMLRCTTTIQPLCQCHSQPWDMIHNPSALNL